MSNHNAFLAVTLGEDLRDELAAAARALEEDTRNLLGLPIGTGFDAADAGKLHMTFLFFGEQLQHLPVAEVHALHAGFQAAIQTAGASAGTPLAFQGFELFPPGKMNLVVARFEASAELIHLRNEVLDVCRKQGKSFPSCYFSQIEDEGIWSPHVTLGKIKATREDVGRASADGRELRALAPRDARPLGLTLLGHRPIGKKWCDWDDALAFEWTEDDVEF